MLEDTINQDVKAALLAGDRFTVSVLRGLKSSLLYAKIASQGRDQPMTDDAVIMVLQKESKKRQESAELYEQGGNSERADAERREKAIIDAYLPTPLTDAELQTIITTVLHETPADKRSIGPLIAAVKQRAGAAADGAVIARIVKERLA